MLSVKERGVHISVVACCLVLERKLLLKSVLAPLCRFFVYWLILFLVHNMAVTLFRAIGALARDLVVANAVGSLSLLAIMMMGGFVLPRNQVSPQPEAPPHCICLPVHRAALLSTWGPCQCSKHVKVLAAFPPVCNNTQPSMLAIYAIQGIACIVFIWNIT